MEQEFWDSLPYYMLLGMTADEYWDGDPYLVVVYRKVHKLRTEMLNQQMWWQGFYTNIAVETALSNFHLDGKRHKHNNYIEKPIDLYRKEKSAEDIEREQELARMTFQQSMKSWKRAWREQYGK